MFSPFFGQLGLVCLRVCGIILLLQLPDRPVYVCLVPFVKAIVPLVDMAAGLVHIDPPDGLLELAVERVDKFVIRGYLPGAPPER